MLGMILMMFGLAIAVLTLFPLFAIGLNPATAFAFGGSIVLILVGFVGAIRRWGD